MKQREHRVWCGFTPNFFTRIKKNQRRKKTVMLGENIRQAIAKAIDGGKTVFSIGSKPVKVCQLAALNLGWRIFRSACQAHVCTLFRVRRHLSLILTDVTGYGLTVKTNPAGNFPQTQTINAMVMKNLFFFCPCRSFILFARKKVLL